jgi:transposase, IS5 family
LAINEKPRTYRWLARKQYLNVAKKKNKAKSELRKAIGQQLRYLRRNLKSINELLNKSTSMRFPLETRDQRIFWVIQYAYDKQTRMYRDHFHIIDDRIVNIYQPYVRPIVRGKDKAQVDFGAKPGVSLQKE